MPKLLTIKEAKERLHCSQSTLYQICDERRIEHVRIAASAGKRGKLLIPEHAIEAFIAENTVAKED